MDIIFKTIVIDDEPIALDKLRKFAEKINFLQIVKTCKDTSEALAYMNENPVDVIFTEVSMPPGKEDGITFIESLPMHPLVVFVSSLKEYASDAYRLSAVDFLLKPYGMMEFQRAARRIKEAYNLRNFHCADEIAQSASPDYLFVRNGKAYDKVSVADIKYINSEAEYLLLYVAERDKPLREKSSFAAIRRLLPPSFVQIHRSTMINMEHVLQLEKTDVVMDDGTRFRVSDNNRSWFNARIAAITVGKRQE